MLHAATFIVSLVASVAPVQDPKVESVTPAAPISEVTLYQGRAMVSRSAAAPEREGLFELRFTNLPAAVDPDSVQATVDAPHGGAKLLDVRYESVTLPNDANSNPDLKKAIEEFEAARRESEVLALRGSRLTEQHNLLNAIAAKTAEVTGKDFGSKDLDPAALSAQVQFLGVARDRLIGERTELDGKVRENQRTIASLESRVNALGGRSNVERTAIVTLGKSSAAAAGVTLRYLVGDATWTPKYAARTDMAAKSLSLEYDAQILQNTGESWDDVRLTLSTAQPTQRAQPNGVSPVYVDVYEPVPASVAAEAVFDAAPGAPMRARASKRHDPGFAGGSNSALAEAGEMAKNMHFEALFTDAIAVQSGTVASFPINRTVTIPSDASKPRTQRIATIDLSPSFVYVAQPISDSAVFLKATTANTSAYQLLSGPITVFLGGDSVGRTNLPDLSPGSEMTFWLGTDRRLEAKRVLVKKDTVERGVFGKSDVTQWQERIDLSSTLTTAATIEVFDRMPVSRNEQITIELSSVAPALATDAKYLKDERPQGVLKWVVALPAATEAGKPATAQIDWTVRESHAQGTQTTPIPD